MAKTAVRVHPVATAPLARLQRQLLEEFGVKGTYEDIVGALVVGTPVPQAAGMLMAFGRLVATTSDEDRGED